MRLLIVSQLEMHLRKMCPRGGRPVLQGLMPPALAGHCGAPYALTLSYPNRRGGDGSLDDVAKRTKTWGIEKRTSFSLKTVE